MRLLIVDDAKTDLDACRTSVKKWNKQHTDESKISELIEKGTFSEAQEYFSCYESCRVDGIILDLKLARHADAGQKLIEELDSLHRRIPIVVFTATQDPLAYHYLLGKFTKGDQPYDAAFERFDAARRIGLTKILGCDGVLDRQLKNIFDRVIMERFDSWVKFSEGGGADVELALSRSVVEHLHDIMDVESDKYAPDEFYVTELDSPSKYVATGEILRSCDGKNFAVVISPACDLALHPPACVPKSEVAQLCQLEPLDKWEERMLDSVKRRMKKQDSSDKEINDLITREFVAQCHKVRSNHSSLFYHYFPSAVGFKEMLLNFRMIEKYTHKELKNAYSQTGYKVSPYFFRDVQSRFSAYYGRQGQPEICGV